ncbi:DUF3152 domain-containing protein [Actinoplanes sp. RD1]|uniref:DUF3152 domain-containing protein n=1 Tax=Actinoplanes sp. RD1 TaxID=3064538 RepID=UPI0027424D14|nr:DUF3152 domain-containing protein [Actinoplanes sp. RD1]
MVKIRTPAAGSREPGAGRRRWLPATLLAAVVLGAGALLLPRVWSVTSGDPAVLPSPVTSRTAEGPGLVQYGGSPSPSTSPASPLPPVDALSLPGKVPTQGSGTFTYAPGTSKIFGTTGTLRRFRVAVEKGSGEDVREFAATVEATLGDARSWTGVGQVRLQRVPGGAAASFTVYLATRTTAGRMCANGGVNITVGGRPYTSCRTTGRAVINLDRWRLSAPTYTAAKVPLAVYRQYVINHEVGHELGRHHEGCPRAGGPAPVMVQQTLTLRGCVPYAWPRKGGRTLRGPAL